VQRRQFLNVLVGSLAVTLAGCAQASSPRSEIKPVGSASNPLVPSHHPHPAHHSSPHSAPATTTTAAVDNRLFHTPTGIVRVPVPHGTITMLPGAGNNIALTVDDGTDTEVVHAYAQLAARTGLRLTFFANGYMSSWTDHAPLLRPLVDSGQAIIANHTWSHQNLTELSEHDIAEEVHHNERFLHQTYGCTGRPFLRPPYGYHDDRVDDVLSELGYPAITMWYGSLGDSSVITPQQILDNARQWFAPQHLVIGHANHDPVLQVMDQIVDIIRQRQLQPVHLGDVFDLHS